MSRFRSAWPFALAAALLTTVPVVRTNPPVQAADAAMGDLRGLFQRGFIFQDRNGDEVIDYVDAHLILGESPSDAELAAAADVAARLGFETSAMNLPLETAAGSGVTIAIGPAGLARAGLPPERLRPGQGIVAVREVEGRRAVVITGGDDAGTQAAAEAFAGRLPHVWDPKGPTLERLADDLREFLSARGVGVASISIPAVHVRSEPEGAAMNNAFERVTVSVELPSPAAAARARLALRELARAPSDVPAKPPLTPGRPEGLPHRRVAAGPQRPADQQVGQGSTPEGPVGQGPSQGSRGPTSVPVGQGFSLAKQTPANPRALSYEGARVVRVRLSAPGAPTTNVDLPRGKSPAAGPLGRRAGGAKDNLDLSSLFTNDGLLGDSDSNLIPDRVEALLSPAGPGGSNTVDLAARLGLESTGIAIPIARPPGALTAPESEPTLVLVGLAHPLVERLIEEKKIERPALGAGEGLIQIVKKAFGEKSALLVTGGDRAGLARALGQVSERFPHIWARGKDRTTLDDIEEDVRRFLSGRSPAGQAAGALYKLDRLAASLAGKPLDNVGVQVFVEKPPAAFADFVRREAGSKFKADRVDVSVQNLDVQNGRVILAEKVDIPSEVEDFRRLLRTRIIPAIAEARRTARDRKPPGVRLEARLSEPPEIRARLEQEARGELLAAGAAGGEISVEVLSAYKQGYSWLYDRVRPALAGTAVRQITIRFAEIGPPPEWKQQGTFAPTRWLLEIYPIDEVLARELKLDLDRIRFEKAPIGSPAYEVIATGSDGGEVFRQTFEPKYVLRSFFDQFPNYEKVRVTTGWMTATVGERAVVDERIVTDPERFWDHFQGKMLPAIYEHVMDVTKGKPRADDAPFFGELRVELTLSEPEYRLGVDEEQISSLEAIHEELYFNTLHFFDVLGRYARGPALAYPGRVIPIVRPKADGKAGHAKISFTGFDAPRPGVVVSFRERGAGGGSAGELRLDIPKVALDRPSAMSARVRDGRSGLEQLDLRVKVDTEKDERDELVKRASEERVDRQIMSGEQVAALLANLGRLRAAGLYREALAYHDLRAIRIAAAWEHDVRPATEQVASLEPNGSPAPFPDIRKLLPAGYRYAGGSMVQWDTPIPPPEAYELLAKMSTFKEATVYRVGESYLGRDVWAMDLMPPVTASHWAHAKATTFKPTIIYSARQHANEVSSTSHVLKLAELLLTDPAFNEKLKKVNVVIHPITNADGAQLAYDLHQITPSHMLHAGYLGSLGVDMTAGQWEADPIYPETKIRPAIWRTWLPDVFLNPHGYPSHEWVQLFSEYAAWVRNRVVETRDYWTMRGWWMPGFSYLDDPKHPRHKAEQFKLRAMIAANVKASPEVWALNQRAYDRYRRYTFAFDQKNFKLDFTDGVLMYTAIKGARASPTSNDFMLRHPNVTVWEGSTEAPDETARGDWLKLVATAGLQWDKAVLEYLVQGAHQIERKGEPFFGGVSLSMNRPRPPKPKAEKETTNQPH